MLVQPFNLSIRKPFLSKLLSSESQDKAVIRTVCRQMDLIIFFGISCVQNSAWITKIKDTDSYVSNLKGFMRISRSNVVDQHQFTQKFRPLNEKIISKIYHILSYIPLMKDERYFATVCFNINNLVSVYLSIYLFSVSFLLI